MSKNNQKISPSQVELQNQVQELTARLDQERAQRQELEGSLQEMGKTLEEMHLQYDHLTESIPDGLIRFNRNLEPEFLNQAGARFWKISQGAYFGESQAGSGGKPILNTLGKTLCLKVFDTGKPAVLEYIISDPAGNRFIEARYLPERTVAGTVVAVLTLLHETTSRKRIEEVLRLSEHRFHIALAQAGMKVFSQDLTLRYTGVYNQQPGSLEAIVPGKTDEDIFSSEEAAMLTGIKRQVLASGKGIRQEICLTLKNEPRYFDLMVEPVREDNGEITQLLCAMGEVTNQRKASAELHRLLAENEKQRAELEDQAALMRTVFDSNPSGIAVLAGPNLEHIFTNPTYRSLTPHPDLDPIGRPYAEVWPQHEKLRGGWLIQRVIETGKPFQIERYPQSFPDGSSRFFSMYLQRFQWKDGPAILLVLWDITQLEEAYQEIERSALEAKASAARAHLNAEKAEEGRRILETLMKYIPEGVAIADAPSANLLMVSDYGLNVLKLLNLDEQVLNNSQPLDLPLYFPDRDVLATHDEMPLTRAVTSGEVILNEEWIVKPDENSLLYLSCNAGPIMDADGEIIGGVLTWRDITEGKEAEQELSRYAYQLERSNKELEQFAFVASHDLQEPLRKIKAFGERVKEHLELSPDGRDNDYLNRMLNASQRMEDMINDLLTYSRVTTKARPFEVVDLNKILEDVLSDLEVRIDRSNGEIFINDLPQIYADPIQMRQLLQNLVSNALKFHRPDVPPQVRISAAIQRTPGFPPHEQVVIQVQDNGIGFDEQFLERIFQPFERLRGRSEFEGSGMGLAICRRIVERHHGTITAHSVPNQGSTFFVTLPVNQPPA